MSPQFREGSRARVIFGDFDTVAMVFGDGSG